MMLRDDLPARRAAAAAAADNTENAPAAKSLLSTAPNTNKPQSKWTANAARIVLAPVDINTSAQTIRASPPPASSNQAVIEEPIQPIQMQEVVVAPVASATHAKSSKLTLAELEEREMLTKETMSAAGKVCMDAWNAALEASRAYRVVRKEWRRAKAKLDKRRAKTTTAEPVVALMETAQDAEPIVEVDDAESVAPLVEADLADQIDEVEQMEEAVHAVEQSEVQYAALTHQTEVQEGEEVDDAAEEEEHAANTVDAGTETEEGQPESTDAFSSSVTSNAGAAPHPNFGVLSFSFGGKSRVGRTPAVAMRSKPTAGDKARAAALKLKLEQDMKAHEARRLALQEQARVKAAEQERRRLAAKEKVDEQLAIRTKGKSDEVERKRLEAESRRTKVHEEEKKHRAQVKQLKRKELEQTIEEMKAKEKVYAKKNTTAPAHNACETHQ